MEQNHLIFEAIALKKCLAATYNRMQVTLAPHILYTRHNDLFIDAITIERDGEPPREKKIGVFKLAGLKELSLADQPFEPEAMFNPAAPKYAGETVFSIEA